MINRITVEINLGNDAVQTTDDVVNILRRAIDKLEDEGCDHHGYLFTMIKLRDINGNTVGFVRGE
jgi:hypothetical protein